MIDYIFICAAIFLALYVVDLYLTEEEDLSD
jgi:hypothetical protein